MQPDWYAHALWSLHKDIAKFFKKHFTKDDLCQGYCMRNPDRLLMGDLKVHEHVFIRVPHAYWFVQNN